MDANAGPGEYKPWTMHVYDQWVLGFSNLFAWRCPSACLLDHYQGRVTARHLDVGVGSGWFLDNVTFPAEAPELCLVDTDETALRFSAERLERYAPKTVHSDVLLPLDLPRAHFGSIGVNYLIHCLPGTMEHKAQAFEHLGLALSDHGVLFGSTILEQGVPRNALARRLMSAYNAQGVFSNEGDDLEGLRAALELAFEQVRIELIGCVALFEARGPRSAS